MLSLLQVIGIIILIWLIYQFGKGSQKVNDDKRRAKEIVDGIEKNLEGWGFSSLEKAYCFYREYDPENREWDRSLQKAVAWELKLRSNIRTN
jgi:hypothetical protein